MSNLYPYDRKPMRVLAPGSLPLPAGVSGRCRVIRHDGYHRVGCPNPATKVRDHSLVCGVCDRKPNPEVVLIVARP